MRAGGALGLAAVGAVVVLLALLPGDRAARSSATGASSPRSIGATSSFTPDARSSASTLANGATPNATGAQASTASVVTATATVFGLVLGPHGRVLPPGEIARVELLRVEQTDEGEISVAVDARGRYEGEVPIGVYATLLAREPTGSCPAAEHGPFTLRAGERREMPTLVLRGSGTVAGRVTDTKGQPIEGATITIRFSIPCALWQAKTDALGRYSATLGEDSYSLEVQAKGFVEQSRGAVVGGEQATEASFSLDSACSLSGQIVDASAPVTSSASVRLEVVTEREGSPRKTVAGDGSFTIEELPPGRCILTAWNMASGRFGTASVDVGGDGATVDIALGPASRITGVVRDRAGLPIEGLTVTTKSASGQEDRTNTEEDGRFALGVGDGWCAPGHYALEVRSFEGTPRLETALDVGPGEHTDLALAIDRGVTVTGHIRFEPEGAKRGAEIVRVVPRGAAERREPWPDGPPRVLVSEGQEFTIPGLAPGSYELFVAGWAVIDETPYEQAFGAITVEVGATPPPPVEIVARDGPVVEGRVVGPRDERLAGISVRVEFGRGPLWRPFEWPQTNARGEFRLRIPEGPVTLDLSPSSLALAAKELGFEKARVAPLTVEGRSGETLAVTVRVLPGE